MKAAVILKPGTLSVKEVPEPKINDYQALVEILACSICNSTDEKIIRGKFISPLNYPGILGHESVGRVIEVGSKVRNYKISDLVLRPAAVYLNDKLGEYHSLFGGFSEFGLVTDYKAEIEDRNITEENFTFMHLCQQSIPLDFDPIDSTMIVMFREILDWLNKFGINNKTKLVILGSGPVGMSMVSFSKLLGAYPVIMVGRRDERLKIAIDLGADFTINNTKESVQNKVSEYTGGSGATHIIEAIGDYNLINEAFGYLKKNGKIGIYGLNSPQINLKWEKAPPSWSLNYIEYDVRDSHQQVVDSIKLGYINPKKFYSHIIDLENINFGLDLIRQKKTLKIVIKIKK